VQVGDIAQQHEAEVSQLVDELLPLGQSYLRNFSGSSSSSSNPAGPLAQQQQQQKGAALDSQQAQLQPNSSSSEPSSSSSSKQLPHELDKATVMEALLSYSLAIAAAVPSRDMARRELAWRNGFFLGLPYGRTPRHCEWLVTAGCQDLL
jgi:hypothetical protein